MLAAAVDQEGQIVKELVQRANAKTDMIDAHGYCTIHYAALQGSITAFEIVRLKKYSFYSLNACLVDQIFLFSL